MFSLGNIHQDYHLNVPECSFSQDPVFQDMLSERSFDFQDQEDLENLDRLLKISNDKKLSDIYANDRWAGSFHLDHLSRCSSGGIQRVRRVRFADFDEVITIDSRHTKLSLLQKIVRTAEWIKQFF